MKDTLFRIQISRRKLVQGMTSAIAIATLIADPLSSKVNAQEIPEPGASPTIDKIKQLGKLKVGICVEPPWLLQDPSTGKYFGVAWEIAQHLAGAIGVPVEPVPSTWDVFIAGLQAGTFELSIAPAYATPKRLEVVDFYNYTAAGSCYAVLRSNEKVANVKTFEDIDNPDIIIGTLTGSGGEQGVKAKYKKIQIDSVVAGPGVSQRVSDLQAGRVDIIPLDSPLALVLEAEFPELRLIPEKAKDCIANPDIPFPIGVAFRKGDPKFERFIDSVVKPLKDSGELDQILEKYSTVEHMRH